MTEFNSKSSRTAVLYTSIIVVAAAGLGLAAAYFGQSPNNEPQATVSDPTKKIGTGDRPSQNPVTIPSIDKSADGK
jgi:uncharacterized protein HemX